MFDKSDIKWYYSHVEVDWTRYKQILLNDRTYYYRPNRQFFSDLRDLFKDINVFGFGRYVETGCWYIIATSSRFPENVMGSRIVVPMKEAITWSKPLLSVVQPPPVA
jgi:hypothetical protein